VPFRPHFSLVNPKKLNVSFQLTISFTPGLPIKTQQYQIFQFE